MQPQIEAWLKLAGPLRLCGRLSVAHRAGDAQADLLEELERSELMLRVRLVSPDIQTARELWQRTKALLQSIRQSLRLPLSETARGEQSILCWSFNVGDGKTVDEIGNLLRRPSHQYLEQPWHGGEKTARERMWLSTKIEPTNVTMTSLPGLMAIVEAWTSMLGIDLEDLSPVTAEVQGDRPEPEVRPIPVDKAEWVKDVTIPDDTEIQPTASFTKIWRVRNAGTVPWHGRYLTRIGSSDRNYSISSEPRTPIPDTEPGETVDLSVDLIAPRAAGTKHAKWKQTDEYGREYFPGPQYSYGVFCQIVVPNTVPHKHESKD